MHSVAAPPPTQSPPDTTGTPVPSPMIVLIAGEWWQFMAGCTLYFVCYKGIITVVVVLLLLIVTVAIVVAVVIVKRKQKGDIIS